MIYIFASDIHGSAHAMHKLSEVYKTTKASKLVLLGDLLYHGPRNSLPQEYNPQETAKLQNCLKNDIFCVRGNCEAEVDQMMLEFPVLSDSAIMYLDQFGERMIYLHHGHKPLPPLASGTIVISGHTHIPVAEERDGLVFINPGSVAIPKGGYPASYCILEDRTFTIVDFEGNVIKQLTI